MFLLDIECGNCFLFLMILGLIMIGFCGFIVVGVNREEGVDIL